MNFVKYPIVIQKDADSDYGVTVPDIPGCYSAASSIEEAIEMAQEAVECHLEGLLMDNDPIPMSSRIENLQRRAEFKKGVWAVVEVDISGIPSSEMP